MALPSPTDTVFGLTGPLCARHGFEYRPQQESMARAVLEALTGGRHLIVEAPTGVGKTLAYLVPAIEFARERSQRGILSTHTRNLQDQLLQKDLPLARALAGGDVSVVVLKGRRNYLCTTRLVAALGNAVSLFPDGAEDELKEILAWSTTTTDGDLNSVGFSVRQEIRDAICSEPGVCSPVTCGNRCHYQRVREAARTANLVIMNHALFFSLLALQHPDADENPIPFDFVVFDEAHTLEAVASTHLGSSLSRRQLIGLAHRLYQRKNKTGLLAGAPRSATTLCRRAEEGIDAFFLSVERRALARLSGPPPQGVESREVRIRERNLVDDTLTPILEDLAGVVREREESSSTQVASAELAAVRRALESSLGFITEFLEEPREGFAYWVELTGGVRDNVGLASSPVRVGTLLGERIFSGDAPAILTSATLSVRHDLSFFRTRIGAASAETLLLDSPFDFARQMRISVRSDMPEPDAGEYTQALPQRILESVDRTDGRALVLFTNASLMRMMASTLGPAFAERRIRLLVQGINSEPYELLKEFKSDVRSVLFGLDSFWMGVDVPGEALEHVIITRLPFAVPTHPLTSARVEEITARGGSPFFEYSLPEAILKFRQGVGRLIRSSTDRGLITILDSRIARKSYGRAFLESLPGCPIEIHDGAQDSEVYPGSDW